MSAAPSSSRWPATSRTRASPRRSIRCRRGRSRPARPAAAAAPGSGYWPCPSAGSGCRCPRRRPPPRPPRSRPSPATMPSVRLKPRRNPRDRPGSPSSRHGWCRHRKAPPASLPAPAGRPGTSPTRRRARREMAVTAGRWSMAAPVRRLRSTPPPPAGPAMRRLRRASSSYSSCQSRRAVGRRHLHGGHLVFRAVGRPVGEVGGDDVGLRARVVEGGVDHARRHAVGDQRAQRRLAGAAGQPHPVAIADAALLGIVRMDFQPVLLVPDDVVGAPRLRADIVLR